MNFNRFGLSTFVGLFAMEETIKIIERRRPRAHLIRRGDGAFTYREQLSVPDGWGPMSLDAGINDSDETVEAEARSRVWWLAND